MAEAKTTFLDCVRHAMESEFADEWCRLSGVTPESLRQGDSAAFALSFMRDVRDTLWERLPESERLPCIFSSVILSILSKGSSLEYNDKSRLEGAIDGRACIFATLYPDLRARARVLGYALAIHGSMVRDFDLVAVPWRDDHVPPDDLAWKLQSLLGGWCSKSDAKVYQWAELAKKEKPGGRLAYILRFAGDPPLCIDLSVTPFFTGSKNEST